MGAFHVVSWAGGDQDMREVGSVVEMEARAVSENNRAAAEKLAKEIEALAPPEKLRLAALLLEERKPELALTILRRVATELGAALMLARAKTKEPRTP